MIRNPASRTIVVRRAFTLVEMLVAIGIIVILAVITVSAGVALVERSEIKETENVLKLLDTAVIEWEAQSDRKITWGTKDQPYVGASYDMYDAVPHVFTMSEILYRVGRADSVKSILAQIKPEVLYKFNTSVEEPGWIRLRQQGDPDPNFSDAMTAYSNDALEGRTVTGMLAIIDPWGTPIRAVHPGRASDFVLFGDSDPDDDGTIPLTTAYNTYGVEEFYGTVRDRRILFVSAGPDGQFGSVGADHDDPMHEWAHDNVVSYSIEDEHQ